MMALGRDHKTKGFVKQLTIHPEDLTLCSYCYDDRAYHFCWSHYSEGDTYRMVEGLLSSKCCPAHKRAVHNDDDESS